MAFNVRTCGNYKNLGVRKAGLPPLFLSDLLNFFGCATFITQSNRNLGVELMPKIEAETATGIQVIEAPEGKKLVLAIEDAGIDILHRCGGNARCTTCRVEVLEGDPGEMGELEQNRLAMEVDLADHIRLSCQIRIKDDLKVRVINQVSVRGMDAGPRPLD